MADTALPGYLASRLAEQYDEARLELVARGYAAERPVTLRANALLSTRDAVAEALADAGIAYRAVPWYPDAFALEGVRERAVWDLPIYQQGHVYLQSLSSMLPPLVLQPAPKADVLDMCAAPGGKTSQMAALSQEAARRAGSRAAHVTACELSAPRAQKLEHNLEKLGATSVQVMRTDARRLDSWFSFDQILLDAPCTGSGTVHLPDERVERRLTPQLASKVERSQRALLDKALQVLKPGGALVYSTCSILRTENEDVVAQALKRHRDCELVPIAPVSEWATGAAVTDAQGNVPAPVTLPCTLSEALLVCPSDYYEGFFVAKIRKNG